MPLRHELHLLHHIREQLRELESLLVEHLALLIGTREEEQLLDELLHILRLRANGGNALLEHLGIRLSPAREQIRVTEDDRHGRAQLVRGVRDEPLLLADAILQAVEHMVEGNRELCELVLRLRYIDAPVHALDLDLACRRRERPDGLQDAAAREIPHGECKEKPDHHREDEELLHMLEELALRRDRPQEMQRIDGAVMHDIDFLVVDAPVPEVCDAQVLVRQERRPVTRVRRHLLERRKVRVVLKYDASRDVRHAQHDARQHRIIRPKRLRELRPIFELPQNLLHREIDLELRLMVNGEIDAKPHADHRDDEDQ